MITTLIAVAAAIVGTAAVQHYRYTERRDLLNRIDAAQLLTEQRQTATALVQAEEGRRLAAWSVYYHDWDNDLHRRERELELRHRKPDPDDEPAPEEPAEAEPAARDRFTALPPSAQRILAEADEPTEHFTSAAINDALSRALDGGCWDEALKLLNARGEDEMPVPTPPTKPAVVRLPSKRKASKHAVVAGKAA